MPRHIKTAALAGETEDGDASIRFTPDTSSWRRRLQRNAVNVG
jgi:hypothetical protein